MTLKWKENFGYISHGLLGKDAMPRGPDLSLTNTAALGLFYIQRYRFLTIEPLAEINLPGQVR